MDALQNQSEELETAEAPRVVYAHAPVVLATLHRRDGSGWVGSIHGRECTLRVDPAVDDALLRQAAESGARVLVDATSEPVVVGVVMTHRPLSIAEDGTVTASVRSFTIEVAQEAVLKTKRAFVRVGVSDVELYGNRVLTRARETLRLLGRMIAMN